MCALWQDMLKDLPQHCHAMWSLEKISSPLHTKVLYKWHLLCRFQECAVETLADVKSFKYPEYFNGRKYEQAIEWLRSVLFTSASSGKASHKSIENAYQHTPAGGAYS